MEGGKRRPGGESTGPRRPVHDTEALSGQILNLKKELAASRAENKLLRVAKEKMEVVRVKWWLSQCVLAILEWYSKVSRQERRIFF